MNRDICCFCAAPRRPTQAPVESFGNDTRVFQMKDYRELTPHSHNEVSPQLTVNVMLYRNGGTDTNTHMCDDCIVVGLTIAKEFVDRSLAALSTPTSPAA